MKKWWIIPLAILSCMLLFPAVVLAASNVDNLQAYIKAQEVALQGLKAFFDFLLDLFKAVL